MQNLSTTNSCGSCGLESATLKKCMGCRAIHYCGRDCQIKHRKAHRDECRRISKEAALVAILKDAVDKPTGEDSPYLPDDDLPGEGASCWICLEEGPDEHGMRIRRGCACRGESAGFAHPLCLAKYCRTKAESSMEIRVVWVAWLECPLCKTRYTRRMGLALSSAFLESLSDVPPSDFTSHGAKLNLATFLLDDSSQLRQPGTSTHALARGDLGRSQALFQEVISDLETVGISRLGLGHTKMSLATTLGQLGNLNWLLGDSQTALQNHVRALSIAKEAVGLPGADAAAVASIMSIVTASIEEITAANFPSADDDEKVVELLKSEVSKVVEKFGEDCERVYNEKRLLCDMLSRRERYGEAAEVMASVVGSATTTLGPDHPMTVQFCHCLSTYQKKAYGNEADDGYEYDRIRMSSIVYHRGYSSRSTMDRSNTNVKVCGRLMGGRLGGKALQLRKVFNK